MVEHFLLQHFPQHDMSTEGSFNLERVLYLTREIAFNDPTKDCIIRGSRNDWEGLPPSKSLFHSASGCGLPIGNLTSQLFSNIYLNELDQFVKREMGVKHYGRYVDDFFLVHSDKWFLLNAEEQIRAFLLNRLGLTLHPKKVYLQEVAKGVAYLGAVVKPYRRYMVEKTKRRIFRSLSELNDQANRKHLLSKMDGRKLQASANSSIGYLKHFRLYRMRCTLTDINEKHLLNIMSFASVGRRPAVAGKPININKYKLYEKGTNHLKETWRSPASCSGLAESNRI